MENVFRLQMLPVLVSNVCWLGGVLMLKWDVADLFFWFWYEVALTGVATLVIFVVWELLESAEPVVRMHVNPYTYLWAFVLVLFFGTLIAGIGMGDRLRHLPEFIVAKEGELGVTLGAYLVYVWATLAKVNHGLGDWRFVELQFGRRATVVVGMYAFFILKGTLFDGGKLNESRMGIEIFATALLVLKVAAETGLVDRWWTAGRRVGR
jgi:hypothetical protein